MCNAVYARVTLSPDSTIWASHSPSPSLSSTHCQGPAGRPPCLGRCVGGFQEANDQRRPTRGANFRHQRRCVGLVREHQAEGTKE
ncbi:hypothetical protein QC761_400303 [Podospora bellae-mahoneyi]|uniref:Uncharacterized protein n=1 Tax=Podospora bellae-mahoneyi TaxID=2093777 RepID=A0ABR0FI38_9PEZI|nr:hypothetical protein QC761_400303 [Podospora bellae-mahoneyi]